MKICPSCNIEKNEFYKDCRRLDGLNVYCIPCINEKNNNSYSKYKDKKKQKTAERRKINPEHFRNISNKSYQKNKIKKLKTQKEYRKNNRSVIREQNRKYEENNINYKLSRRLRTRLYVAIRNEQKTGSAVKDLGCSIEELKLYLEKQFYNNLETGEMMTWKNYSLCGWHIDHIKPLSSFDLTNRDELLKAVHYTNLQPLWAKENLQKSDKIGV